MSAPVGAKLPGPALDGPDPILLTAADRKRRS